jgi:hypothetical protein
MKYHNKQTKKTLIVVNYPHELSNHRVCPDRADLVTFKENKWFLFAIKLLKYLLNNDQNYDHIIHYWLCGWQHKHDKGKIFAINQTFLMHENQIIESQKYSFHQDFTYFAESLPHGRIVTKTNIGQHSNKLYDFGSLFDIETYWVSIIKTQLSIPICSLKGVSDTNDVSCVHRSQDEEINFLLHPHLKRSKKNLILSELWPVINILTENFIKQLNQRHNQKKA